jgi:hypothetical protein
MSRSKGDAAPLAVVSVMDRLKQLYFEKIRPLEEAYAFGEFYSCVVAACAPPRARCHRARALSLPPPHLPRRRLAPPLRARAPLAGRCTRRRTLTPSRWSCCEWGAACARALGARRLGCSRLCAPTQSRPAPRRPAAPRRALSQAGPVLGGQDVLHPVHHRARVSGRAHWAGADDGPVSGLARADARRHRPLSARIRSPRRAQALARRRRFPILATCMCAPPLPRPARPPGSTW